MKKLLLSPFLLVSLFSLGGELKANPGSRYELPDPGSSLSESQSNSKNVWYLLNQTTQEIRQSSQSNQWRLGNAAKLNISTFANKGICNRFAFKQKAWLTSIDLGSEDLGDGDILSFRYKPYTKCIMGRNKNDANYRLEVNNFFMYKNSQTRPVVMESDSPIYFNTLYFKDLTKCNIAKSQIDNWFRSLKTKFFNKYNEGYFLGSSTKCISKT